MSARRMARPQIEPTSPESTSPESTSPESTSPESTSPESTQRRSKRTTPGKVVKLRSAEDARAAADLGTGAHFARLFKKLGEGQFEAHLMTGQRLVVGLAPGVDAELADLCLAEQEIVLIGMLGGEVVLFGALRTRAGKQEEVLVEAPRKLVLRSGKSKLVLSADGKIKLSGNDVTVDAPREVRLASARVEIP